jgi:hypothetical protein
MLDPSAADAELEKLPMADHAVLPLRQLSQLEVTWALSSMYVMPQRAQVGHAASVAAPRPAAALRA